MDSHITRQEVNELIKTNNDTQDKYLRLQFQSINDKLDKLIQTTDEFARRQNSQEIAILGIEKDYINVYKNCPHKDEIVELRNTINSKDATTKEIKRYTNRIFAVGYSIIVVLISVFGLLLKFRNDG